MSFVENVLRWVRHGRGASLSDRRAMPASTRLAEEAEYQPSSAGREEDDVRPRMDRSIEDLICVEEVSNARFFVNGMFQRRFGQDAPDYPRHFVAFYKTESTTMLPVAYVHYSRFDDSWLCGGLMMDNRAHRRISREDLRVIKKAGGVAELVMAWSFPQLRDAPAIWGYVGDKQSDVVTQRVGFVHTAIPCIMVVWNRALSEIEKQERLDRVVALGPF